jgi:acyl carrier protein
MKPLHIGLAEIFEVGPSDIHSATALSMFQWDSLAIVSTIALVDEIFGLLLDGKALSSCELVSDIETLVGQSGGF